MALKNSPFRKIVYSIGTALLLTASGTYASASFEVQNSLILAKKNSESPNDQEISSKTARLDFTKSTKQTDLPKVVLDRELLFALLSAEIAPQYQQWGLAYRIFMDIAKRTKDTRLSRKAVEAALNMRDSDKILQASKLWYQLDEESNDAAQLFINVLIVRNDFDQLYDILSQRLKQTPADLLPLVIFQTQRLLARSEDKKAILKLTDRLLSTLTLIPEIPITLAQTAYAANDAKRVEKELARARSMKPDWDLPIYLQVQMGSDRELAMRQVEEYLSKHPRSEDMQEVYARLWVEKKNYPQAITEFEKLLRINPHHLPGLYALGVLHLQQGNYQQAEHTLSDYVVQLQQQSDNNKNLKNQNTAYLALAHIAEHRNDPQAALRWLESIEADETNSEVYLNAQLRRAHLLAATDSKRIPEAIKILDELRPPSDAGVIAIAIEKAQALRNNKQFEAALKAIDKALEKFPENTDLLYERGICLDLLGQYAASENVLRKIIEIQPNHALAMNALGYSLANRNTRLQEAYQLILAAYQLMPSEGFILDSLGWVYFRMGDLVKAEQYLRKAYQLRSDLEIGAHLVEVLHASGQVKESRQLLQQLLKQYPADSTLSSLRKRLGLR